MAEPAGPTAAPGSVRSALDGMFRALRGCGVRRNTDDRWLAGVCSGVADRLGVDPLLVRGVLIVLLLMGGIGGLAYLVAWALLPDGDGRILAQAALRGDGWGIALLVVIAVALLSNLSDRWWLWFVLVPVGVLAWWALRSARAGKTPEQMGEEARELGNRVAASFAHPTTADGPPAGAATAPGAAWAPVSAAAYAPSSGTGYAYAPPPAYAAPSPDPGQPAPHGMGPGRTGTVAGAPRVIHQARSRAGLLGLLLAAGLAVAGYGVGQWYATSTGFSGPPELLAVGFAVAGAGLALVVIGLTGRRAGGTAALVALAALFAGGATSLPTLPSGGFGERAWVATSQPAGGFSLTAGEARLDLTGAPAGSTVRVAMGAGQLDLTVPAGTTLTLVPTVRAGQVVVHRVGTSKEVHGGVDAETGTPLTVGTGPTAVTVDASMVAGEIVVTEAGA